MEYFVHLGADSVDAIKQACGTEIEALNVTENGTYTADSGKAYNPVIVNVESGGDSDLSIAVCTIIVTSGGASDSTQINGVYLDDAPSGDTFYVMAGVEKPYNAIMYRGVSNISIASTGEVTASGDIELEDDGFEGGIYYYNATVYGDCVINCVGQSLT